MGTLNDLGAENLAREPMPPEPYSDYIQANAHAVSWAAIFVGATAAAALSLILLMLGGGLGLSSISPWANAGIANASTFGLSTIIWIAVTQILASGMGGYLAGRLRVKWSGVHADEVHFRDTAHGFLAWAVATLVTAAFLTSVIGAIMTGSAHRGESSIGAGGSMAVPGGTAETTAHLMRHSSVEEFETGPLGYFIDSLFRQNINSLSGGKTISTDTSQKSASSDEITRIFLHSMDSKVLPSADAKYAGQLVVQQTGLTQLEAEKRVNDAFDKIQTQKNEATDKLRKATIYATLWLFVSLLMGAFSASLAATWGGRSRDA